MKFGLTIIASLFGLVQSVFSAETSFSELTLVRQALADAALEKGVSVVSSAYVDEDGELVESSFYRSGATLRGIRMPQYFEADPYDAQVLFSDTALNVSLSCRDLAPHKYRKAIGIDTNGVVFGNELDHKFSDTIRAFKSEIEMSATSAVAENSNYYVLPVSNRAEMDDHRYYTALSPRSNSADARNTNFMIHAEILNLHAVRYSPEKFYKGGLNGSKNIQRFIKNGFKRALSPYQKLETISESSFNFELVVSLARSGSLGSAEQIIAQESVKLRYDRDSDVVILREPFLDGLKRLIPVINEENLSSNEVPATARDLSIISQVFKSVLEQAADQINCEVEMLRTYEPSVSTNDRVTLNHGLLAGINIGDRFLLSESDFISGINPVSSTQLENLSIAEVTQTSEYSSELRIVEGSRQDLYSLSAVPF